MPKVRVNPYNKNEKYYTKINTEAGLKILENIKNLYNNCKGYQKTNVISLVSKIFNRKYLKKLGFNSSNKQYNNSKRKADNDFNLENYKRFRPLSKLKTSEEIKKGIVEHIKKYSNETKNMYHQDKVYYLQQTKKYIYGKYIENNLDSKLSFTTFYKFIPKYFKYPKRESDKCPLCNYGKTLISKRKLNEIEKRDKEVFIQHEHYKNLQKSSYNEMVNNLTVGECVVVMDFKQNFILGKGPIETNHDFYHKIQVSCLGFYVMYKNGEHIVKKYVDYFSKILSHDSLYVIDCIRMLIKNHIDNNLNKINFWSDNGCHFRSLELYNYILNDILTESQFKETSMNFFAEYHGKSEVDGHFGMLQKVYNFYSKIEKIDDIEQLMDTFHKNIKNGKKESQCFYEIYSRLNRPEKINKMMIKDSKKYLSFRKLNDELYGGSVYKKNVNTYEKVGYEMKEVMDKRNTRYSFYDNDECKKYSLGSRVVKMIKSRVLLDYKNI